MKVRLRSCCYRREPGRVAHNNDVPAIERRITDFLEYYDDYLYNRPSLSPDVKAIAQFERKEITKRLAQLFNDSLEHTVS